MTDQTVILASIIASFPGTISAILGYLNNQAARRAERYSLETKNAINTLEKNTNSKMDKLLEVTASSEFAKGKLEGQEGFPSVILRQEHDAKNS